MGARNKRTSKLRQMLAARGFRMPEDVVAEVAGLNARGVTMVELAMQRAEQVAAWIEERTGGAPLKREQLIGLFVVCWKEGNGQAAALLPYGLEKMTPDQAPGAPVVLMMPGARVPGDSAKVIDGSAASDMAPPPLPGEVQRNQPVSVERPAPSGAVSRTEMPSA